jgi:hypothetical protein
MAEVAEAAALVITMLPAARVVLLQMVMAITEMLDLQVAAAAEVAVVLRTGLHTGVATAAEVETGVMTEPVARMVIKHRHQDLAARAAIMRPGRLETLILLG